jgi:hypothetical protein
MAANLDSEKETSHTRSIDRSASFLLYCPSSLLAGDSGVSLTLMAAANLGSEKNVTLDRIVFFLLPVGQAIRCTDP